MMQMQSVPRIRRSPSDPSLLPEYGKYHEDPTEYADTVSPEIKAVEASLDRLCYMATGIKQLRVFPSGGTFKLGSGDASLEVPQGAVDKETTVRYTIILHGPFVFLAGHKLVSVVVYLNMDGAILLKPVLLHLSHWCIKEEGEDQDTLKFATAPHILPSGQQYYDFEEQEEASFTTHTNVGILKISEPQCLHCVEAEGQKSALYRALTFSQRPSEGVLFFRIQLMCNSLDWIKSLTAALLRTGWKKTSCDDIVSGSLFEYCGKVPIEASLVEPEGYNWTATVEGNSKVEFKDFFLPKCKCTSEIEEAIQSGRSPPSIDYKIVYTIPQKQQVKPAVLKVALRGKDLELLFSCPIMPECSQTTAFTDDVERGTDSAQNTALAVNGGKHTAIVSQTVSDRPDHLMLFRTFVSRNAATKGRAVLEGVWLDSSAIEACFNNADSEEAAVQAGLVKWKDGHSRRPPTWEVLLTAMDYAKIAQQHIQDLRKELALDWES